MEENRETDILLGLSRDCYDDPFLHSLLTRDQKRVMGLPSKDSAYLHCRYLACR